MTVNAMYNQVEGRVAYAVLYDGGNFACYLGGVSSISRGAIPSYTIQFHTQTNTTLAHKIPIDGVKRMRMTCE